MPYPTPARSNRGRYNVGAIARSGYKGAAMAYNAYHSPAGKETRKVVRRLFQEGKSRRKYQAKSTARYRARKSSTFLYRSTATRMGRFPKGKKMRTESSYAKYGSIKKVEHGGVYNDSECVYIGHSTFAHEQVIPGVCRAIVRELVKQMGQDFVGWEDTIKTAVTQLQLSYRYYLGPTDNSLTQVNVAVTANMSMFDLAQALYTSWNLIFGTTTHYIQDIWINEVAGSLQTMATIRAFQFDLDILCVSTLSLQNRTLAGTGAGENDQEMTDISNNPLVGKMYEGRYTGFIPDYRENLELNYTGYTSNPQTGLILAKASQSLIAQTKKPPPAWFFHNCKKTAKAVLAPGIIRTNTIRKRQKMSLHSFLGRMARQIGAAQNTNIVNYMGNSTMFGLEKALNSRATEADISVAYELNQKFCIAGNYRKMTATVPILEIN